MATSIYKINKGINQSIEFKGLKAQYIWYLGGGVILLIFLFAILYIIALPTFVCIGLIGICGTVLVMGTYRISRKYGEHGLMKAIARRQLPSAVRFYSRKIFLERNK